MFKPILIVIFCSLSILVYSQSPNWTVNEGAYLQSQTLICKLNVNGKYLISKNDMVGAFVGNECRGVGRPVFVPSLNRYLTYFTLFSNNQGDSISFRLYDSNTGLIHNAVNKLVFNINAQIGSAFQSYIISTTKLNNEAKLTNFSFSNTKVDSSKVVTDLITGKLNNIYFIPMNASRLDLIPVFSISTGASAYIQELPLSSGISKVDGTKPFAIQVLSEDESTLAEFNVEVRNSVITDIFNIDQSQFIKVGPNPFYGKLNIEYNLNSSGKIDLEIRNIYAGNIIFQQRNIVSGTQLSLDQVTSGVYLCTIYSSVSKNKYQFKLVKL